MSEELGYPKVVYETESTLTLADPLDLVKEYCAILSGSIIGMESTYKAGYIFPKTSDNDRLPNEKRLSSLIRALGYMRFENPDEQFLFGVMKSAYYEIAQKINLARKEPNEQLYFVNPDGIREWNNLRKEIKSHTRKARNLTTDFFLGYHDRGVKEKFIAFTNTNLTLNLKIKVVKVFGKEGLQWIENSDIIIPSEA